MNIAQVVITDTISIFLLLTLLREASFKDALGEKEAFRLKWLIYLTMLSSGVDMILALVDGRPGNIFIYINYLGNVVLYITPVLIAWCWLYFSFLFHKRLNDYVSGGPLLRRILLLPGVLVIGLSMVQLFTPVLFAIDQNNIYHRLGLSWLSVGVSFFYLGAGALIFYYRKAPTYYKTGNIILFIIPIIGGTIFQFTFYGVSTIFPSVTIGLTGFYISCHNEIMMRDPLTGLLNRTCFMSDEVQKKYVGNDHVGVIMVDVDRFKQINDSFVHLEGDRALKAIADVLKKVTDDKDLVFRFGGDEFLILSNISDSRHLQHVKEKILAGVRDVNESGHVPYCLSVSCGTGRRGGNEADRPEDVLKEADFLMYEEKKERNQADPGSRNGYRRLYLE